MEKTTCKQCGKIIEGYTLLHVRTLLAQHQLKHENDVLRQKGKEAKT